MKNAKIEGLKEVARWAILLLVSWIITETSKQFIAIPEFTHIKVWVLVYTIPVRYLFTTVLALIGRWVDKYLFEVGKLERFSSDWKGLLGF